MRGNLAALGVGLLLACGVLGIHFWQSAKHFYRITPRRVGNPIYARDATLGYALHKNVTVLNPGKYEFTNSRAIRVVAAKGQEFSHAEVLSAGCSFTYGLGVPQEKSYSAQIEHFLPGVRVANIGVSGYGTVSSRLRSLQYLDLNPRVVVYGFIEDHIRRNFTPCTSDGRIFCRPLPHLKQGDEERVRLPPSFLAWQNFAYTMEVELDHEFDWKDVKWAAWKALASLTGANSFDMNARSLRGLTDEEMWRAAAEELEKWRVELASRGTILLMVYIPDLQRPQPMAELGKKALQPLTNRPGFELLDMASILMRSSDDLCLAAGDCHPSAKTHRLIAKEASPIIQRILQKP